MVLILKYKVFVWTLILMVADTTRAQDTDRKMSLREKAVHHYDQLVRTLNEIKKTGLGDLATTLSAGIGNHDIKNDDVSSLILRTLLASCPTIQNIGAGSETNINIFNNATVSFASRDKKKKSEKSRIKDKGHDGSSTDGQLSSSEFRQLTKSSEELATWVENLVRPINFTLKREGHLVRVTFDVLRTEPAVVSHTWTFEGEQKYMKGPTDYGLDAGLPISSPIDFVFNASGCPPETESSSHPRREHFAFTKKSTSLDSVTFIMPTCFLDVVNGMKENSKKESEWNEPEDEYTQKLYYPNYWNKVNATTIQIESGKNVTFDIEVAMGMEDHIMIEGTFYNATNDSTFVSNSIFLQPTSTVPKQIYVQNLDSGSPQQAKLLDVKVLNLSQINGSIPGIKYKYKLSNEEKLYHVSATIRITAMTANENVSGRLLLQHEFKLPLKGQESFSIMSLGVMKSIQILRPDQTKAIPKGKYFFHTKQKFQCGDRGFSRYQGYGNNCTFFCSISGTNLKSIRVRKVDGTVSHLQKYAEVTSHNAILFANLGPTRKEIDGKYECKAIEIGGKRHKWTVTVGTWGFPKVEQTTLDVQNDSSTFVCVVASERPANVSTSLYVGRHSSRIDGRPNVTRVLHKSGNETRLEVTLPTSYLRWPNEFLACEVENGGGSDGSMEIIGIHNVPDYYYQTNHPFLLRNESQVTDHRDGVASVKCVATAEVPLEINFYFNPMGQEEIVKNNSMNIITTERKGDKTITSLKIATATLKWPRHTISCRAENEYGKDSIDFELAKVIHQYF